MKKEPFHPDFRVLIGIGLVLAIPFALTLQSVKAPRPVVADLAANPTPHGYTWSLSLFIVPTIVLALWVSLRRHSFIQKKAFWFTAILLATGGVMLDICLGLSFFTFVNHKATLGLTFWGYSFTDGWQKTIPIEEIAFYAFGILLILLAYIWGDEVWFAAYNADDGPRRVHTLRDFISFHVGSAVFGALLFSAGFLYKKFGPHPWHDGFPGYWLFLTMVGMMPSILFLPIANPYINWRAFSLAYLFLLLVSLFWEAAIAVPYQWWGYQPRRMVGLLINGFSGLPVEAPILWLSINWATVIVYETLYTLLHVLDARKAASGH